jgi:hypothetical protein
MIHSGEPWVGWIVQLCDLLDPTVFFNYSVGCSFLVSDTQMLLFADD